MFSLSLSESRVDKLATISSDIGQVFFASILVGPVINGVIDLKLVGVGLILSLSAWLFSLLLTRDRLL
ncbi:hypothetical protein A3D42_01360 [Candidatus Nomurabacteria bacterium RIFCSPHIGHO2_02_FULL_41_18]|uniref:Major facilitator superfamily (MFS) profile domain-containing protein n=1 Tax=Candidatus Nomurabacteria bacterium RIFCSPHIGHO2_02_FULL_41_18 TaxID=1801754 RepID=A0A1F6W7G1_9BACT|nr:MAG: hypothetical protein A3D42_01360 [Candidatus Nomurabacteria bacterium RIFCSPHIGHO2_02_FULL_41_18]OGI89993.1 MAG: hypothetical protein A3B01_02010 [Candidatus Nomurabacteria bacterium RIFCSPLOWO2_01_FULL_41_52b]